VSAASSPWIFDERSEERVLARFIANDPSEEDLRLARTCLSEIRADPLHRGQPQRTEDDLERSLTDPLLERPPPHLVAYWARVALGVNLAVLYVVNTADNLVVFADLGPV
jgi:hypothetical protein